MLWARWKPDANQYYKNDVLTNYSVWTSGVAQTDVIYKAGNQLLMAKNNTTIPTSPTDTNVFYNIYKDITDGFLPKDKLNVAKTKTILLALKIGELQERLTFGNDCINNTIGFCKRLHNNVFGSSFKYNYLSTECYGNTFVDTCYWNFLGNYCHDNFLNFSCDNNVFNTGFVYNFLGENCDSNIFNSNCQYNILNSNCSYNNFGNYCINNSFGNNCINNSFGNNCGINIFGNNCINNNFGNSCTSNSFGNSCNGNSFGNNCGSNSFLYNCISNYFGNSCNNNNFGSSCDYNNLNNDCDNNIFGDNVDLLFIKSLRNKDISSITTLKNNALSITVEGIYGTSNYIYWYINSSKQAVYTQIP